VLGLIGNVLYSVAYLIDIVLQTASFRNACRQRRWVLSLGTDLRDRADRLFDRRRDLSSPALEPKANSLTARSHPLVSLGRRLECAEPDDRQANACQVDQFFIRSDQFSPGLERQGYVDAVIHAASIDNGFIECGIEKR
jgi:hypothetical protein